MLCVKIKKCFYQIANYLIWTIKALLQFIKDIQLLQWMIILLKKIFLTPFQIPEKILQALFFNFRHEKIIPGVTFFNHN